jgi:ribosomal protein S18 acetylase RimI-like enzyme
MEDIKLRYADFSDIDFVVNAIVESLKSGTETVVYCKLFNIDIEQFKEIAKKMLNEDFEGHDFHLGSFLIAEVDGIPAGTCTAWVENCSGVPSSIIRANLLLEFIDGELLKDLHDKFNLMHQTHLNRDKNSLQIEFVYVDPKFRGKGIAPLIIEGHIQRLKKRFPDITKAQVIASKTNDNALKAYQKIGFETVIEKEVTDPEAIKLIPATKIVLMERAI